MRINPAPYRSNNNMLVPWYLMAAYTYEGLDVSIIPDSEYDWICRKLNMRWKRIEHRHKCFISRKALQSQTGSYLDFDMMPGIIVSAAEHLALKSNQPIEFRRLRSVYRHKHLRNLIGC